MPTGTTVYAFQKPTVGGDADTWGGASGLNGNLDDMDILFASVATTGSSNAYVLTSGLSLAAYATGQTFRIRPNFTNSGAATINVDGLGAKSLTKQGSTALASGDLTSGRVYTITYDGTQFQVMEYVALGTAQPLDGDLTAIAALSTNGVPERTGTDTWAIRTDVVRTSVSATFTQTMTFGATSGVVWRAFGANDARIRIDHSGTTQKVSYQVTNAAENTYVPLEFNASNTNFATGGLQVAGVDVVTTSGSQTLTNKTITGGTVNATTLQVSSVDVVTTTGSQTLTNKTLTSPTINTPTVNDGSSSASMQVSSETTGALTSASRNRIVRCAGNITLPASGMTDGDVILIDPRGTARTVTRPAAHTMYVNNTDVATGTTGAHNIVVAMFHSSSKWTLQGSIS